MLKICVICKEAYTPESVGLDLTNKKHNAVWNRRTICSKTECMTRRKRENNNRSKYQAEKKLSGKTCDICKRIFYPNDYDLDMRTKSGRSSWARYKRCPNPECHAKAKSKYRPRAEELNAALELSLAVSDILDVTRAVFDVPKEAANPKLAAYRKMLGKRM